MGYQQLTTQKVADEKLTYLKLDSKSTFGSIAETIAYLNISDTHRN